MKRPRKRASSVAVIDIGSNSVRLVVYEAMARSLITIFNEKALCGLGREVQSTGLLAPDAVTKALTSLRRFRALCRVMKVGRVHAIATAACRDASNGPDFIAKAERICGVRIEILSGPREAKLSALGVVSGVHKPDGIVGDLGGGSVELIDVHGNRVRRRRDAAARKSGAAGSVAQIAEARRTHRQGRTFRRRPAQGRPRPHLLRSRRNMARTGAHPHHPERIPVGGDARLFDTGAGRARFRAAPAPSGIGEHAGQHRSRRRCAAAVAGLCRACSRIHHSRRKAEDHRIFNLRGARRPSLRNAAGGRALQGRIYLRRAEAERTAVAIRPPRRRN